MRAAVMRNQQLIVTTVPDPEPGPGEVLVRTLACGIVRATFDPRKNAANLKSHGVSLAEGDGVLNDPLALTIVREELAAHS